jgi:hypothetical protein
VDISGKTPDERVQMYKDEAIRELERMHATIKERDCRLAMHHKIVANVAIDEMVAVSELLEKADKEKLSSGR